MKITHKLAIAVIMLMVYQLASASMLFSLRVQDLQGYTRHTFLCSVQHPIMLSQSIDINTGQQVMTMLVDCTDILQNNGAEEEAPVSKTRWYGQHNPMTWGDWQKLVNRVRKGSPMLKQREHPARPIYDILPDTENPTLPTPVNRIAPEDQWFDDE